MNACFCFVVGFIGAGGRWKVKKTKIISRYLLRIREEFLAVPLEVSPL